MRKKFSSFMNSKYILIGLSALCLLFIATSFFTDRLTEPLRNAVSAVVIPVQKGMNYIGLWVSDKYDTLQEMTRVLEENKNLQECVDSLTEENNQLKQDSYELSRLRDLYELDERYPGYTKVGARVIGTSSDNWYSTFTIDKGSDDGIEKDMNVIAGGGLVGIISEVGSNYALVKTVIEDNSYVSGMLIDTGDTCIVKGDIELMDTGLIHLQGFGSNVTVRNGDKIVTSNISDKYLPGILVGYAKDITADSNNLTQSGYLVPAVDFGHLQEVLIITEKKESH
ncbi:MAG: rod shape-determining protein MreC [Lachnospira sp.]|nr:rod shape-determining protein MreC [Lachnospira sp.]